MPSWTSVRVSEEVELPNRRALFPEAYKGSKQEKRVVLMKLHAPFIQLPLLFDAALLAKEISSFEETAWLPHPAGFAGNDFLPLISAEGDPRNEAFEGPMRPTPFLSSERPYLFQTLASLGAVLGRTRLMRLSAHAAVDEHVDVNYYWRDRMRVHVPILTQPSVRFHAGGANVHMAPGECWIFDTWSLHRVDNDSSSRRVHLVADTVGGQGFWGLMMAGRTAGAGSPNWAPQTIAPSDGAAALEFENLNAPLVMSPWELREQLGFLLSEAVPNQPQLPQLARAASALVHKWRALWARYGDSEAGIPLFRQVLEEFIALARAAKAQEIVLKNDVDFWAPLRGMVLDVALSDQPRDKGAGEQRFKPN